MLGNFERLYRNMTMEDLQKVTTLRDLPGAPCSVYTATVIYRGRSEDGKTTSGKVIENQDHAREKSLGEQ